MTAYRHYWTITTLLLIAAITAIYYGFFPWAEVKFPELQARIIVIAVFIAFRNRSEVPRKYREVSDCNRDVVNAKERGMCMPHSSFS